MNQTDGLVFETSSAVNQNKMKQKKKILSLLHIHGYTSAPDLSTLMRISLPTCIMLLNDLISQGLVINSGVGESKGGRKPSLYGLPDDALYVISCDFDHYSAKMAIVNSHKKIVSPIISIDTNKDDPGMIDKLYNTAMSLLQTQKIDYSKVIGIGVDMPGLIDSAEGVNFTIKDKAHRKVKHALKQRFNKLVYFDNDARMHAHGEFCFGAAKLYKDAIVIHWSWGIGVGIFVNGQLYSGNNGFAGELSHIPIVENGDLCFCGKRGCLETVASLNTVMKGVKTGFENQEISSLINHFQASPETVTPEDVISFARKGDELCISILNNVGKAMGKGLSYLIQLLNPEVIVLSGPLSKARQYVLSPIQQSLNRYCLEHISANTSIVVSELGEQSALLGTSEMVYKKAFTELRFEDLILK